MLLTRWRAKAKLSIAVRLMACAFAACIVVQSSESRADVWQWLTDLVQDSDIENAALSGAELPSDATVTGRAETRVLHLGRDVLELYPSTAVTFEVSGKKTTVHLISGTIRAKVAKRKSGQTFTVETLTLVGAVKGTEFEVSAIGETSAVSVYEGRVAVRAVGRVGGIDVTPGKSATVASAGHEPSLGETPKGGAAAAAKAVARGSTPKHAATSGDDPTDGENKSADRRRDANIGRASSGGGSNPGYGSGSGDDSDGEGGEGGGGESGDDGEDGEGDDD